MDKDVTKTTDGQDVVKDGQSTAQPVAQPAAQPAADPAASPATDPPAAEAGKMYTDAQLAELKASWQQEYEQAQSAEKDFAKMTPEQKAQKLLDDAKAESTRLLAELADRDLADYARGKLSEVELPAAALSFIKGKDQADTDARIKAFGELLAAGVQAGVEKRFKDNGYTPRSSAAGNPKDGKTKKARGVAINEK